MKMTGVVFLCALLFSLSSYGAQLFHKGNSGFNCQRILDPNFEIIGSGHMTTERMQDIKDAAEEIFGKNGIIERLGISSPKQTIQFLPGSDLNSVAALNRYPVGHWHEGAQVSKGDQTGLIYEIVIPGRTVRHSFFRDDSTFADQVSILMHVAGHNHFSVHNRWRQSRTADLVQESYELDAFMDNLKRQGVDPDEISRWYQYLLTLTWAQDVVNGTTVDNVDELKAQLLPGAKRAKVKRTANILQTYIANLLPEIPEWKREMAKRFERLQRYISGVIHGKIMNEGFATLLQEIVPKHTSYNTFNFGVQYCCLMSGVTRPSLGNPYWLGLEAWRHLYERFLKGHYTRAELDRLGFKSTEAQPDIQALDRLGRDRAFIEWVTKNIIEVLDDSGFLEFAFKDGIWLAQQNLSIVRPAREDEFDREMGPPPNEENDWQWIVESREPDRVLRSMIKQVKGFEFAFPQVEVTDMNDEMTGMIRLELSDQIGQKVGLTPRSIVQTLYVHALFNNRPVSLESTGEVRERIVLPTASIGGQPEIPDDCDPRTLSVEHVELPDGSVKRIWSGERVGLGRFETRVFPNGNLEVYRVLRDGSSSPDSLPQSRLFPEKKEITYKRDELTEAKFKKLLKNFVENLAIDDVEDPYGERSFRRSVMDRIEDQALKGAAIPSINLQLSVPTLGKAIHSYDTYVKRRLHESLKRALKGQGGIFTKGQGVSIKALPDIPQFEFDQNMMRRAKDGTSARRASLETISFTEKFHPDDVGRVAPVPGRRGDRHWGPNPNKRSGDPGDEGDEGDSEDGDQPANGRQPGEGSQGVSWVDISLEDYARALEDVVELPRLRPKGNKSLTKSEEKGGKVFKRDGQIVAKDVIKKAYKRGLIEVMRNEEDPDDFLPPDILRRGIATLKDSDYVVRSTQPKKDPEISAQVTFILDLSGSMSQFVPQAKRAFFDLRAILMRRYKNIVFRFIAFESNAVVFDDPEKFFRAQMGGGTDYVAALNKDLEVKKQFPPEKYDRFSVLVGDMEDYASPEFKEALESVIAQSQYVAALKFSDYQGEAGLEAELKGLHESEEFFGYTTVTPVKAYTPYVFRRAFKNVEE